MPERARNIRLVESAMLQILRMKRILTAFEETLESSRRRLDDAYETLNRVAGEREERDQLPNWVETNQKGPVLRPAAEKIALELRDHARRVHGHNAKQLYLAMAEEYERLAGKPDNRSGF